MDRFLKNILMVKGYPAICWRTIFEMYLPIMSNSMFTTVPFLNS